MTETLYRKSWEPLSEADKSEPQVVRVKSGTKLYGVYFNDGYWSVPRFGAGYDGKIFTNELTYWKFLCLTPVTPEDKG